MKRFRYRYYDVEIPQDCEDDLGKRLDLAILQVRDRQRIYRSPAMWWVVRDDGSTVRICQMTVLEQGKGG